MPNASASLALARAKIVDLEAQLAVEQNHLGYSRKDQAELQTTNATLRATIAGLEQEGAHLAAAREANHRLLDAIEIQRAEIRQLKADRERSSIDQAEITTLRAQLAGFVTRGNQAGEQDENAGVLEAAVARAYADALRKSLRNMATVTQLHGLPPDGEALLSAIDSALDKANSNSIKAGVVFLNAQEKEKMEEGRTRMAEEKAEGWNVNHSTRRHVR